MEAIVYLSLTGHTEAYARMLGEKTGLPVLSLDEAKGTLSKGAKILYCGWLCAGSVKGYKKAAKRYAVSCLCGVGLGETGAQDDAVRKACKVPESVPVFTLQGGMEYEELKGVNRFMIKMLRRMLEGKKDRTPEEDAMLTLVKQGGNFVAEEHLAAPLAFLGQG